MKPCMETINKWTSPLRKSQKLLFGFWSCASLQCTRILGRRNLVRVRNIVVAAIFDFMTMADWESRNSSLLHLSNPYSSPLPFPISREVSTLCFRQQIARPKKTPALQANLVLFFCSFLRLTPSQEKLTDGGRHLVFLKSAPGMVPILHQSEIENVYVTKKSRNKKNASLSNWKKLH